jgi:hypothetical protein
MASTAEKPGGSFLLLDTCSSWLGQIDDLGWSHILWRRQRHRQQDEPGISEALSVDECMKAIEDDAWFVP